MTDRAESPAADAAPAETTTDVAAVDNSKIKGALLRYRVMAWATGIWLLVLCTELIVRYGADVNSFKWVEFVHGWVYFVYLLMAIDLAIRVRWSPVKAVLTALAGTIPFLSFYVEHIRTQEVKQQFDV